MKIRIRSLYHTRMKLPKYIVLSSRLQTRRNHETSAFQYYYVYKCGIILSKVYISLHADNGMQYVGRRSKSLNIVTVIHDHKEYWKNHLFTLLCRCYC